MGTISGTSASHYDLPPSEPSEATRVELFSIETYSNQESLCPGEQSVILFSSHYSYLGNSMKSKMRVKAGLVIESYVQRSQEKTHIIVVYEFGTYLYLVSYIRNSLVRL